MKTKLFLLIIFLLSAQNLWAGAYLSVSSGNRHYKKSEYDKSLDKYREAQISSPDDPVIRFNIGDALNKTGDIEGSDAEFSKALNAKDRSLRSKAYYNLGNNAVSRQKLEEALDYYKKCLDLNPGDMDAKYNIEYITQQKNQPQNKQNNKDNKKDKDNKDNKDKQKQQSPGKDKDKSEKNNQQDNKNSMSKEDAQRILQYYNDQEKKSAEKRKMNKPELPKVEEDW
jgi:tetratricopeptide (TPR) repeat protein